MRLVGHHELGPISSRSLAALGMTLVAIHASAQPPRHDLYRSPAFTITDTSVVQGPFAAIATSRDTILSTYPRAAREVHFRFAIDGVDDEFRSGIEHVINVRPTDGRIVTPAYPFAVEQPPAVPSPEDAAAAGSESGVAQVTFRVDMRDVQRRLNTNGFYDLPNGGRRIAANIRHTVYVLGDVDPLTWDTRVARTGTRLQLTDPDSDGVFTVTLPIATAYTRPALPDGRAVWARGLDVSRYPRLASPQRLLDATYRLSLEELQQLARDDGALSAGAKWPGVWTRDVSLSGVLALALVVPDALRASLLAKVDSSGRIIQDTGTGGSWPVSTDRMTWALAAWELYAATGDREWLRNAYDIIARSAQADLHAARDASTGLFRGESSFLDWREQSYPRWMDPKDIYQSEALGTNAVHHAAYRVLARMANVLGEPSARWTAIADSVQDGMIAHLWQPDRGWFGQFRYGRVFESLSPRAEALGESLAILYGAATVGQRERLASAQPLVAFGTPTFWPYIAGEPLYHNGTIWPFVTAYSTWAAADAGNTAAVERGLASLTRATALFLTNKENMVAATGHFEGTALNSDRQLWSVAGTLAATYRVLFGMRLEADRLTLRPMVPPAYGGERTLSGVHYRDATLTITVRGAGSGVARARLDGRAIARADVPATLTGEHTIEIDMDGKWPTTRVSEVPNVFAPPTPRALLDRDQLAWIPVSGAATYRVYRDGAPFLTTAETQVSVPSSRTLVEYQVLAVDSTGVASFLSEPVRSLGDPVIVAKPRGAREREHAGFTGTGYVTLARTTNTALEIPLRAGAAGTYALDVRYANGSGPVNTDAKVAVRTLLVDGREAGVLVMPQRGANRWSDWGYSNALRVRLAAGAHVLRIVYTPLDVNMDRAVSTALLDHARLTPLGAR